VPPLIGSLFGLLLSSLAGLPRPLRVPVGLECGVQNKLVAMSVLSLILDGPSRDAAFTVPILYAVFASAFAFLWGLVAWQAGWTYLDRRANLFVALRSLRKEIHQEMRDGEVDEVLAAEASTAAALAGQQAQAKGGARLHDEDHLDV
jgi:hypothetical protein